jgi:thiol-disulfide isomerase/thioredoxin
MNYLDKNRRYIYMFLAFWAIVVLFGLLFLKNKDSQTEQQPINPVTQAEVTASQEAPKETYIENSTQPFTVGKKVPAFEIRTVNGSISNQDLLGQPTLLEFIATWCPHCQKTTPSVKRALDIVPTNFVMVGAADENDQVVTDFFKSYRLPGQVGFDDGTSLIRRFGGTGYPTLVYLNSKGELVLATSGESTTKEIVNNLRQIEN